MGWLNSSTGELAITVLTVAVGVLGILIVIALNVFVVGDGVRQMMVGRYAFLPMDRFVHNRLPTTTADCVLQGASRVFGSIAAFLIVLPVLLNAVVIAADLFRADQAAETLGLIVMLAGFVICWPVGLALVAASMLLEHRIRYTYLGSHQAF